MWSRWSIGFPRRRQWLVLDTALESAKSLILQVNEWPVCLGGSTWSENRLTESGAGAEAASDTSATDAALNFFTEGEMNHTCSKWSESNSETLEQAKIGAGFFPCTACETMFQRKMCCSPFHRWIFSVEAYWYMGCLSPLKVPLATKDNWAKLASFVFQFLLSPTGKAVFGIKIIFFFPWNEM